MKEFIGAFFKFINTPIKRETIAPENEPHPFKILFLDLNPDTILVLEYPDTEKNPEQILIKLKTFLKANNYPNQVIGIPSKFNLKKISKK
jgi:hypothetical protein